MKVMNQVFWSQFVLAHKGLTECSDIKKQSFKFKISPDKKH